MRSGVWKFADVEFSPARGLARGGVEVPIQAKPRGLLELLLRAKGTVVRKDTIAAALWSTEAPSDASIARAVNGLRNALGGDRASLVRTVYGDGVQLVCPVEYAGPGMPRDRTAVAQLLRTAWEVAESRRPEAYARALETLRYAVTRYPHDAPAWALLADAHVSMAVRSLTAPRKAVVDIQACCEKALRADPYCAQALAASGWALGLLMDRAEDGLRRVEGAIHDESDWPTFLYRAWLQIRLRDLDGALESADRGLAGSPHNRSMLDLRAFVLLYQGRFAEADAFAREAQKVRDDVDGLWVVRSIVASEAGDHTRACAQAERAAALMGRDPQTACYLAYAYAKAGHSARARKTLAAIGPSASGHTLALLAAPYLALGEMDEARRIVAMAEAERCPYIAVVWCDPRTKSLWSRPIERGQ